MAVDTLNIIRQHQNTNHFVKGSGSNREIATLLFLGAYCIMQIVRGEKVLRLHDLLGIHGITFTTVQQFDTPYTKKEKICWYTLAIGD